MKQPNNESKLKEKCNYSKCFQYILENKKHLNEYQKAIIFDNIAELSEEKIQDIIYEINLKKLSAEKIEIYNLNFFENECSVFDEKSFGKI